MDFKILSKFIIVLGIVFLAYGSIQWVINLPKKFNPSEADKKDFLSSVGAQLALSDENMYRKFKRGTATKVIVAGGIVLFFRNRYVCFYQEERYPIMSR